MPRPRSATAPTVENLLAFAGPPPSGPALPSIPPPLPQNATAEQITARKQAIKEADQIGLTAVTDWWANLMSTSASPLQENLTLFWHNHFATSNDKVNNPPLHVAAEPALPRAGRGPLR